MKHKDYLMQIKKLDKMIENKIYEQAQWKNVAYGTTVSTEGERVTSSGSKQKMADAIDKYVDLEREIDSLIDQLVDKKKEIIETIECLGAYEYDILHKMYVQDMDRTEIAEIYGKTESWVDSVKGIALNNLQEILDGRERNNIQT